MVKDKLEINESPSIKIDFLNALSGLLIILILLTIFLSTYLKNVLFGKGNKIGEIPSNNISTSWGKKLPIDADFLRGRFPGMEVDNIPYFGENGSIGGLMVYEKNLSLGSVTTDKIAIGSVNSFKILDGSIQTIDIADDAVTGIKIQNDTIMNEDIAADEVNS